MGSFAGKSEADKTSVAASIPKQEAEAESLVTPAFVDNRSEAAVQRKQQGIMQRAVAPMQFGKDAADWISGFKRDGYTSYKVISPKNGPQGLFEYPYKGDNIIDTFQGTNSAGDWIPKDLPSKYQGLKPEEIYAPVPNHNLISDQNIDDVANQKRSKHFSHADKEHGTKSARTNSLTWHHKDAEGQMELIDMNVHGAMFHYGGYSQWQNSMHSEEADEDPDDSPA